MPRPRANNNPQSELELADSGFSFRLTLSDKLFVAILTAFLSIIGGFSSSRNLTNCPGESNIIPVFPPSVDTRQR